VKDDKIHPIGLEHGNVRVHNYGKILTPKKGKEYEKG